MAKKKSRQSFEKRRKEEKRRRKQEEKRQRRFNKNKTWDESGEPAETDETSPDNGILPVAPPENTEENDI